MIKNKQDLYWIDRGPVSTAAGQQGISEICATFGQRTKEKIMTMFADDTLIQGCQTPGLERKTSGNMNMQGADAVKVDELKYLRPTNGPCTGGVGGDEHQGAFVTEG